jgi:hypothetical protein
MDRDPPRSPGHAAGILAVLGGILVPTAVAVAAWGVLSKPIAYPFLALAVGLGGVGGAFVAYAAQLDRDAAGPTRRS